MKRLRLFESSKERPSERRRCNMLTNFSITYDVMRTPKRKRKQAMVCSTEFVGWKSPSPTVDIVVNMK